MGRKCLNVARGLRAHFAVTIPNVSLVSGGDGRPALDDATLRAIEGGLEAAAPLDIVVSEARSRLVIRKHLARRISSLRTRSRVELKSRTAQKHRLKRVADGMNVAVPSLEDLQARGLRHHICLSHQWRLGQDVVRVIKVRMADLVPSMRICLDETSTQHEGACAAPASVAPAPLP